MYYQLQVMSVELGTEAYSNSDLNNGKLLNNLEGCEVHDFIAGTEEHEGTALMVVELPTGEGLGVQVSMNPDGVHIPVYDILDYEEKVISDETKSRVLELLSEDCPIRIDCVGQYNIMDAESARVLFILEQAHEKFAIDLHLHDDGGTDFFEIEL